MLSKEGLNAKTFLQYSNKKNKVQKALYFFNPNTNNVKLSKTGKHATTKQSLHKYKGK